MKRQNEKKNTFFRDLRYRFYQMHIDIGDIKDRCLPVMLEGVEIGEISYKGKMWLRKEYVEDHAASDLYERVAKITAEVKEYTNLMDSSPRLEASGFDEPYLKLAEFNGFVLCGKESEYGVQFATWMKDYGGTGVVIGHYFGNDYSGAKQDFAVRCGLINGENLFTPEQFVEIYRRCSESLNENFHLSWEQEQVLENIQQQIEELVPDLIFC